MAKFILERHAYAPELNRVIFKNGASLPAPGCTTIAEARKKLFSRRPLVIVAKVRTVYPSEYKWLERTTTGTVSHRTTALEVARRIRRANPGGKLINGDYLPAAVVLVTTEIKGA